MYRKFFLQKNIQYVLFMYVMVVLSILEPRQWNSNDIYGFTSTSIAEIMSKSTKCYNTFSLCPLKSIWRMRIRFPKPRVWLYLFYSFCKNIRSVIPRAFYFSGECNIAHQGVYGVCGSEPREKYTANNRKHYTFFLESYKGYLISVVLTLCLIIDMQTKVFVF